MLSKKKEEETVNTIIKNITNLIENADKRRSYELTMIESRVLNHSKLFNEKMAELRKNTIF